MREVTLYNQLRRVLKKQPDIYFKKLKGGLRQRDDPDYLITVNGLALFVEFKRPGEKPRKSQELRLRILRAAGCSAIATDNLQDVLLEIEKLRACTVSYTYKGARQ